MLNSLKKAINVLISPDDRGIDKISIPLSTINTAPLMPTYLTPEINSEINLNSSNVYFNKSRINACSNFTQKANGFREKFKKNYNKRMNNKNLFPNYKPIDPKKYIEVESLNNNQKTNILIDYLTTYEGTSKKTNNISLINNQDNSQSEVPSFNLLNSLTNSLSNKMTNIKNNKVKSIGLFIKKISQLSKKSKLLSALPKFDINEVIEDINSCGIETYTINATSSEQDFWKSIMEENNKHLFPSFVDRLGVDYLFSNGANSLLGYMVSNHKEEMVAYLLENNANPNIIANSNGLSPLFYALKYFKLEDNISFKISDSLINFGSDINLVNASGHNVLMYVVANSINYDKHQLFMIIDYLLARGSNITLTDKDEKSVFNLAGLSSYDDLSSYLYSKLLETNEQWYDKVKYLNSEPSPK